MRQTDGQGIPGRCESRPIMQRQDRTATDAAEIDVRAWCSSRPSSREYSADVYSQTILKQAELPLQGECERCEADRFWPNADIIQCLLAARSKRFASAFTRVLSTHAKPGQSHDIVIAVNRISLRSETCPRRAYAELQAVLRSQQTNSRLQKTHERSPQRVAARSVPPCVRVLGKPSDTSSSKRSHWCSLHRSCISERWRRLLDGRLSQRTSARGIQNCLGRQVLRLSAIRKRIGNRLRGSKHSRIDKNCLLCAGVGWDQLPRLITNLHPVQALRHPEKSLLSPLTRPALNERTAP